MAGEDARRVGIGGLAVVAVALTLSSGSAPGQDAGPIVITEIHYHPASGAAADEFVEIRNIGGEAVDLSGWRFSDGISFLFPAGTSIAPDEALAIRNFEGRLADEGERVTLADARGRRMDRVEYDDDPPWPQDAGGKGLSLECVDPTLDNEDPRNWLPSRSSGGTPGKANSVASTNLPPLVAAVDVAPARPAPAEAVVVQAAIEDGEDAIANVYLDYDANTGVRRITLRDDGAAPDLFAGDNVFTGTIPGVPDGTYVSFAIEARDARAARSAKRRGSYPVVGPPKASKLPVYQILVRPSDWSWLEQNLWTESTIPAVLVAGDEVRNVGLRFRGGRPRLFRKKSLKIVLDGEEPLGGFRELNLNAAAMDDDYMTEPLAYWFYARCGVPAARTRFVRVERNGAFWGLFIEVESVDDDFLAARGLSVEGALYKAVGIASSLRPLEGTQYDYRTQYEKKEGLDESYDDLIRFVGEIENPPGGAEAYLRDAIDVQALVDYLAATNLMCVWDAIQHNYYLHRDTVGDGRWRIIPWDLDHAWGEWEWVYYVSDTYPILMGTEAFPFAGVWYAWNNLWTAFLNVPAYRRLYFDRIRALLNSEYAEWTLFPKIEEFRALIAEEVLEDEAKWPDAAEPLHAGPRRTMAEELPVMKQTISGRRRYLANLLGVRLLDRPPEPKFVRGDPDGSGVVDLADAIGILSYIFSGGTLACVDAADIDDGGTIDLADAIRLLSYLFASGSAPRPPFPECGADPNSDGLSCERPRACP